MLPVVISDQQVVVEQAGNAVAVRVLEVVGLQIAFERNLPVSGVVKFALVEGQPPVITPVAQIGTEAALISSDIELRAFPGLHHARNSPNKTQCLGHRRASEHWLAGACGKSSPCGRPRSAPSRP